LILRFQSGLVVGSNSFRVVDTIQKRGSER